MVWIYTLAATGAGLVGALVALFWRPEKWARSAIQHFAAGLVIAAVASEVIPEVERIGGVWQILGGFIAGGLAMIVMKSVVVPIERKQRERGGLPTGLAAAAAVDTLIDGALSSAGFATGPQVGIVLTVALAAELLFLTLSVGAEFRGDRASWWLPLLVTIGITAMFPLGALGGKLFLEGAAETTVAMVLAFGAAALIYLVAEELLVETIEAEESLTSTATLFAGFVALFALKLLGHGTMS
jgi:ZIP family zinc transporter